jgi:putative chitinase
MRLDRDTLRRLWPRAPQALVDAVAAQSATVFARHGLTTRARVVHFLAQISHESGGGTIVEESLNYTTPARIAAVWPKRFTVETAAAYTHNPRKLADRVYNGRMGNKPGSDDGYNYRGRGLLQITGRSSYREIGALCSLPLEERPELAYAPSATLEVAAAEFEHLGALPWCDKGNLEAVTRRVNGGYTGLASRKEWFARWDRVVPRTADETVDVEAPSIVPDDHPLPELPRGSDEVLPVGVDKPGQTMGSSTTAIGTVLAMITGAASQLGGLVDQFKPLLADPQMRMTLLVVGIAAGGWVLLERWKRMQADRQAH